MVHSFPGHGRRHDGPGLTRQRPNDGGGPSSHTRSSRKPGVPCPSLRGSARKPRPSGRNAVRLSIDRTSTLPFVRLARRVNTKTASAFMKHGSRPCLTASTRSWPTRASSSPACRRTVKVQRRPRSSRDMHGKHRRPERDAGKSGWPGGIGREIPGFGGRHFPARQITRIHRDGLRY